MPGETEPTTLLEFADVDSDDGDGEDVEADPTPSENAEAIELLGECVDEISDQIGTLIDRVDDVDGDDLELEESGEQNSDENHTDRMFQ